MNLASITVDDVAVEIAVTDKQIQQEIDDNRAEYVTDEKRVLEQIGFKSEDEAKAAKAAVDGGKTFEALAAERKLADGDFKLGELTQADLAARAKAAFALPPGGTSAPIKFRLGADACRVDRARHHRRGQAGAAAQAGARQDDRDRQRLYTNAVSSGANVPEAAHKST